MKRTLNSLYKSNLNKNIEKKIKKINLYSDKVENKLLVFDQLRLPSLTLRHDIIGSSRISGKA